MISNHILSHTKTLGGEGAIHNHWVTRPKNFIETDTETFFRDQNFWDQYRDFYLRLKLIENDTEIFLRPNIFDTDTETFFETKCFRDRYWDFFWDLIFRDWYWYFQKNEKSLNTEKSLDEMSHSGCNKIYRSWVQAVTNHFQSVPRNCKNAVVELLPISQPSLDCRQVLPQH